MILTHPAPWLPYAFMVGGFAAWAAGCLIGWLLMRRVVR